MRNRKIGIILQARFNSRRLRGKALASVGGVPVLTRCLQRLLKAKVGPVVLATTDRPEDDALAILGQRTGASVFRGSSDDVLGRFVDAAARHGFDVIIRATADNPAVDMDAPRRLIDIARLCRADYACEDGLPCGAGLELVTATALARSAALATGADDREHVTTFIKGHPELFSITCALPPKPLRRADLRFTIDTTADLLFMRRVFARVRAAQPRLSDIIAAADASSSRSNAA